jgi:hypothetical protein
MSPPSSQFPVPIAEMKIIERTSKPNLPVLPNEIYAIFQIEKDCPAAEKPPTAAWISRMSKVTIEINQTRAFRSSVMVVACMYRMLLTVHTEQSYNPTAS